MDIQNESDGGEIWLGQPATKGNGKLWIGQHAVDGDLLVFDDTVNDSSEQNLSFFSLSQFRQRTFSRAVVEEKIHELTDQLLYARAKKQYRQWPALRAAHEHERDLAREAASVRQKEGMRTQHRLYMERHGLTYEGVRDSASGKQVAGPRHHRTRCHACGVALDDFVGATCLACNGVLCTCGACGCRDVGSSSN